ncbi:beta family protein [Variovorax sp. EL159]|uniref:beta family protein n=1 Tax=Variovorax sp. EL159 TaxID=1566270 RepID=UPI0008918049|nr:beta family protein [Variovorax sp. EL159]SCX47621.1 Beta protein [Variovorax sp. EL159]
MELQYIPFLKALDAEKEALENLKPEAWSKIIPLFDIPRMPGESFWPKYLSTSLTPKKTMIDMALKRIASVCAGRMAMVDSYHWRGDSSVETGEHIYSYLINQLNGRGVIPVPVIGYDRWSEEGYKAAVGVIDYSRLPLTCLRLDYSAIEDSLEPDLLRENVNDILDHIGLEPSSCAVLIDYGDVYSKGVPEITESIAAVVAALEDFGFKFFCSSASSLPPTVDKAIRQQNSQGQFRRKEMAAWKMLSTSTLGRRNTIIYGDYAIRGPHSNEGIPNKNSNGKIRYTISEHFFIARGHSVSEGDKFSQFYGLAQHIVDSNYYLEPSYSWGDAQIEKATQGLTPKQHAFWIAVDTNHHMTFVPQEISEFAMINALRGYRTAI